MIYHLPSYVSFGMLGDRAVALDLRADRYYLVAAAEAAALRAAGTEPMKPEMATRLEALTRRRLLGIGTGPAIKPVTAGSLRHSALEAEADGDRVPWPEIALFRADASVCLRLLGLRRTLGRWRTLRRRYERRTPPDSPERAAIRTAQGFAAARLLLPAKSLCVPDSLTLARILWRRGIDADVFFGVRLAPFLAHAWVQRGDMLLSDTLNTVGEYTPVFRL